MGLKGGVETREEGGLEVREHRTVELQKRNKTSIPT